MSAVPLPRPIYIVSDGTGETAEKVVRATLHQFSGYLVHLRTFPNVSDTEQLGRLVRRAKRANALLVTTLVRPEVRRAAKELTAEHRVPSVDLLGGLLAGMGGFLQARPAGVHGLAHQADDSYFERVAAVEFTVKADDGKEPRLLSDADIVLVGVSRTSKTPLSVFLAHKGYRVSNVPIVLDRPLKDSVERLDQRRVFGLTIDPETLRAIRRQRMATMRMPNRSNYDDMHYILAELEWAESIFRQHPSWPVIDVTRKAVEETAASILQVLGDRGLTHDMGEVGQL